MARPSSLPRVQAYILYIAISKIQGLGYASKMSESPEKGTIPAPSTLAASFINSAEHQALSIRTTMPAEAKSTADVAY